MKNEEITIEDQFKELEKSFSNTRQLINLLKFRQWEMSSKGHELGEDLRPIVNDAEQLVDQILILSSEASQIKKNLMITHKELKIIRENSDPINLIYLKTPLLVRIAALVISPLSFIQLWKILTNFGSKKNRIYKEENQSYKDWE